MLVMLHDSPQGGLMQNVQIMELNQWETEQNIDFF